MLVAMSALLLLHTPQGMPVVIATEIGVEMTERERSLALGRVWLFVKEHVNMLSPTPHALRLRTSFCGSLWTF